MNGDESDHENPYPSIDGGSSSSNDENDEGIAADSHSNVSASSEDESDSEYVPTD